VTLPPLVIPPTAECRGKSSNEDRDAHRRARCSNLQQAPRTARVSSRACREGINSPHRGGGGAPHPRTLRTPRPSDDARRTRTRIESAPRDFAIQRHIYAMACAQWRGDCAREINRRVNCVNRNLRKFRRDAGFLLRDLFDAPGTNAESNYVHFSLPKRDCNKHK